MEININALPKEVIERFNNAATDSLAEIEINILNNDGSRAGVIVNDFVYRSLLETIELLKQPNFLKNIEEALKEPIENCIPENEVKW